LDHIKWVDSHHGYKFRTYNHRDFLSSTLVFQIQAIGRMSLSVSVSGQ